MVRLLIVQLGEDVAQELIVHPSVGSRDPPQGLQYVLGTSGTEGIPKEFLVQLVPEGLEHVEREVPPR